MSLNKAGKSAARTYRERHQPQDRNHLGLLEKKKDYKLRAKDFSEKKEVLKHLRKKALNKNPDEFYFHMANSKTVDGGVHRDLVSAKVKDSSSKDQIRLMQTQDYKYVSMRRLMEQKKIEKLKSTLHLLDDDGVESRPCNSHTIFVDDEAQKRSLNLAKRLDTVPEMLGRVGHRPKLSLLKSAKDLEAPSEAVIKKQKKAYKQLNQRINRAKQLAIVEQKMNVRRQLNATAKKTEAVVLAEETADSAPVLKWRSERKR